MQIAGGMLSSLDALQQFTTASADIMNSCDEESKTWFSRFSAVQEDISEPVQVASSSQHLLATPALVPETPLACDAPTPSMDPDALLNTTAPDTGDFIPGIKVYSGRPRPPGNDELSSLPTASQSHHRQFPQVDKTVAQIQANISSITLSPPLSWSFPNEELYPNLTPQQTPSPAENDCDVNMPGATSKNNPLFLPDDDHDGDSDVDMPGISSGNAPLAPPPLALESPPQPPPPAPDSSPYKLRLQHPKEHALPPPGPSTSSRPNKKQKQNKVTGRDNVREEKPVSLTCTYECYDRYNLVVCLLSWISDSLLICLIFQRCDRRSVYDLPHVPVRYTRYCIDQAPH